MGKTIESGQAARLGRGEMELLLLVGHGLPYPPPYLTPERKLTNVMFRGGHIKSLNVRLFLALCLVFDHP